VGESCRAQVTKRRTRRTAKFQRAVVGASLDEIKKKRSQKPAERSAQREAALKEVRLSLVWPLWLGQADIGGILSWRGFG
jgi:hypothetical protein